MTGLSAANVLAGGAIVNDGGFAITIGQNLLHGGSGTDGGFMKLGAGTLTLRARGPTTAAPRWPPARWP